MGSAVARKVSCMKWIFSASASVFLIASSSFAQTVIERGPHHNIVETIETEEVDGETVTHTNQFTQLGTGLNYWDETQNAWTPSSNEIELLQSGATYRKGQFKLLFAANINDPNGNLEWFPTPDTRIVVQTIGIAMTEVATGDSVFLAEIKDTQGFLTAPNEITYPACFDNLDADVRIVVNPFGSGFQNDVILHQRIPDPATFGFQGEVRIEAWHQIISGPNPDLEPGSIQRSAQVIDSDTQLRFGWMSIGPGTAFLIGTNRTELIGAAGKPVRVAKEYFVDGATQMRFLVEAVPLAEVAPQLQQLPAPQGAFKFNASQKEKMYASRDKGTKRRKPIALAQAVQPRNKNREIAAITRKQIPQNRGLLLDFTSLGNQSNYTLRGDTTYVVATNTTVTLSGTTVIEPGCVIKFDGYNSANNTPIINITGPLDCQTKPYAPCVLTSREDRTVGETNSALTTNVLGIAYGAYHLCFPASNNNPIQLHDIRSRFAQNAFGFLGTNTVEAWNIQVYGAYNNVFEGAGNIITLRNVLVHNAKDVAVATANNTSFKGEHFTVHQAGKTFNAASYTGCTFNLTNSLLVVVTNSSSSGLTTVSSYSLASDSGIFQTVGSGAHYLVDNSPYRNTGSTVISTNLSQGIFRYATTFPPILLANSFSVDTTLAPQAARDWDEPDAGYHYPALDWAIGNISVSSGVTLTLTNGVAVAGYDVNSLTLNGTSKFYCEGRPLNLNRFVRYNVVQEQPLDWGATAATMRLLNISAAADVGIRFTEAACQAYSFQSTRNIFIGQSGSSIPVTFTMHSCEIYSSTVSLSHTSGSTPTVKVINNLFHRANAPFLGGVSVTMNLTANNNLHRNGAVSYSRQGAGTWSANSNVYDHASPSLNYNSINNIDNAYESGATPMSGASNSKFITTFDYQIGIQGRWYYPTVGGNLFTLIDGGTGTAGAAGLYHYTVRTDHVKDTGTIDIGYHYIATDANGAIDTDGDGIPDYLEDRDGDGVADAGETNWQSSNGAGIGAAALIVFTPLQ